MNPDVFINAWAKAAEMFFAKQMQYLNDPAPKVQRELQYYQHKLVKLHIWSAARCGKERISKMLHARYDSNSLN